ncbi:radical SAM protein [Phenylobacterium sp. J367]|nr:radical SAM protein [Phenylobacterium sp. J367]MCR5879960.1 radical SAM protein [Phenylobacterium sp. J367]
MFGPIDRRDPVTDWAEKLAPLAPHSLKVLLDVSNKCNLRCRMCHFSYDTVFYRPSQYMTPDAFAQIAAKVFPYAREVVLSAGSEPLTSPHFVEILQIAGQYGLPELKFLTNAQLLTPEIGEAVIAHGVTQIDVSIDGATKATYEHIRRGGSFERLKANLARLTARKRELGVATPLLQFNLTLMRANLGELDAFVDLAEELGVARIGARHLMPYDGLGMDLESLSHVPDEADAAFRRFLDRAARSAVKVINFPDFFRPEPPAPAMPCAAPLVDAAAPEPATFAPAARNTLPLAAHVDQPAVPVVEAGDVLLLQGWAVDGGGRPRVVVERDAMAVDPPELVQPNWRVRMGEARFVNGSRFDIAELFPDHPGNNASAWTFEVRREDIWSAPRVHDAPACDGRGRRRGAEAARQLSGGLHGLAGGRPLRVLRQAVRGGLHRRERRREPLRRLPAGRAVRQPPGRRVDLRGHLVRRRLPEPAGGDHPAQSAGHVPDLSELHQPQRQRRSLLRGPDHRGGLPPSDRPHRRRRGAAPAPRRRAGDRRLDPRVRPHRPGRDLGAGGRRAADRRRTPARRGDLP